MADVTISNLTNRQPTGSAVFPYSEGGTNTGSATTGITIQSTGSSGTNANMPPYYALAYIIKL